MEQGDGSFRREDMFILNVETDDPIRVMRKYEEKPLRLIAVCCPPAEKSYRMLYAWEA